MAEKELVLKEKVVNDGIFDYKGLYKFAHAWLIEESYGVEEGKYAEKVSGNSRDIVIEWKATKKISDYFKAEHSVKFNILRMSDVEVEIDGKKKSMQKGEVEVEIKSTIVIDHESKWEENPTLRFFREIYNKYIIPSRVDALKDKIAGDGRKLKEEMKAFLDLYGRR